MGYKDHEREKAMEEVPYQVPSPELWPNGVRVIGNGELDNLGIDRDNVLYWNGRVVMIRKGLFLTFWQKIWAAVISVSALLVSTSAIVQGFTAYSTWACSVGLPAYCAPG